MLTYPILLEDDDNDTLLVTSPDFPELTTFGEDREDAILHSVDAMEEVMATRMHLGEDIPRPSPDGDARIELPTLTAVKVILYQEMREQDIGSEELARRLIWSSAQVDLALDLNHHSRLDELDTALRAVGRQLQVTALAV